MLVTEKLNETGKERIRALVESQDGFVIAETDLKLRGPGEFFGTKQSGLPSLQIANILRDPDILSAAKREARAFVENPPSPEAFALAVEYIKGHWQRRYGLVQVG
jgi:ATP-dependent DNA helicase RecG